VTQTILLQGVTNEAHVTGSLGHRQSFGVIQMSVSAESTIQCQIAVELTSQLKRAFSALISAAFRILGAVPQAFNEAAPLALHR